MKTNRILAIIGLLATTALCAAEVFFSAMLEGSGSNKALAIYNGNDTMLDLTGFQIERYNNGATLATDTYVFTDWGFSTLLPGEVFVVANPGANPAILGQANHTHSITFYNGDDAIALIDNGVIIDQIGEIGVDPGSGWPVGIGATNNFTLARMNSVCQGQTDWTVGTTEWNVFPIDASDGLSHFLPDCQPAQAFFSEYVDGPGNNQAIEIYNPGPYALNLNAMYVGLRIDGGPVTNMTLGNTLPGYLTAGDHVVISNPAADDSDVINVTDIYDPVAVFDGNDGLTLFLSGPLISQAARTLDRIGTPNQNPGPGGWTVSGGSTNDFTLIRQKQVCSGSADWLNNANQWQAYFNTYFGDLGSHTIRDCTLSAPNLVWVWSFDTERGLFITDGSVADADMTTDFNIFELVVLNSIQPSLVGTQFIEFQPFQGFNWDGSVPIQFYRSDGNFTTGANFFSLAGPSYGFAPAPDESFLTAGPERGGGGGTNLAQGEVAVVMDTIFLDSLE